MFWWLCFVLVRTGRHVNLVNLSEQPMEWTSDWGPNFSRRGLLQSNSTLSMTLPDILCKLQQTQLVLKHLDPMSTIRFRMCCALICIK